MDSIFNKTAKYTKFPHVSRETINSLIIYENYLLENNKKFNLISKSTEKHIWNRHFLDSIQLIDFIDKNCKICADLGSGAGFPGLVMSIAAKERKMSTQFHLYEKSVKKSKFLNQICKKLNLNTKVISKNVFDQETIEADVIVARAFKPLKIILQLIHEKSKNLKNLLLFLGKSGKQTLLDASKIWEFEYKELKSVTSDDSLIINIKRFKKKFDQNTNYFCH